ncbi:MAG TPA: arginine N-succinyltransferase [Vitreimonas sp.]|uniref:arginine N-succinyltransferase n=1 Tax=Vitreimonas sp. TaxID=3069702 RepID=UPI002D2D01C5|nr:arginine N-succinyltransferase [Vitreimonas sp.]HYD89243.1 arginine N-succinyltransferase [Vitreimonas sp.]
MSAPVYVMRAAGPADLAGFKQLREIAGAGFTSLMLDDKAMADKLALSERSYGSDVQSAGAERYFIALEHIETGALAGCAGVKATIGETPPFFNFRLITEAQSSAVVNRRFDLGVLIGVNDFTGCSEVGSLFVRPEHRAGGVGRALAQSRYMLMAAQPERFRSRVVSELRGVVSPEGVSPFWEAVGRHFFRMDFSEADKLSATTDNQFILDLMPQHPIYVELLGEEARAVIGQCHKDGEGARRLLEWEGFSFSNVVDIFDAGPLMSAPRDAIRTRREARRLKLEPGEPGERATRALAATARIRDFRCVSTRASLGDGVAKVDAAVLAALKLEAGEEALVWLEDAH